MAGMDRAADINSGLQELLYIPLRHKILCAQFDEDAPSIATLFVARFFISIFLPLFLGWPECSDRPLEIYSISAVTVPVLPLITI